MVSIFLCVYWPLVYLWKNIYSNPLTIKNNLELLALLLYLIIGNTILKRNCFSSVIVQLNQLHICLILTIHLCFFILFFFSPISLGISMSFYWFLRTHLWLRMSCCANEIPYFIAMKLLWCFIYWLCIKI